MFWLFLVLRLTWAAPDPLVTRMETNVRGTSFQARMQMTVRKPGLDRTLTMKLWTKGRDKAIVKILTPAKDKGTSNLRLAFELWQFVPNVDKIIRIPPSLMLQNWMGSNFTNDDLVRMSSLETDYTHQRLGEETFDGQRVVRIECTPKPEAPVVWGKVIALITLDHAAGVRQEFYTEGGKLVKTLNGSNVKSFGTHWIPTSLTMMSAKEPESTTRISYEDVVYDRNIEDRIFTQQNLKVP